MVTFTTLHFKDKGTCYLALKLSVSRNAITLVSFCFPELVWLQAVMFVQFRPGQMRLSSFRWLHSHSIGLVQYTDNHNVRLNMIWERCNFLDCWKIVQIFSESTSIWSFPLYWNQHLQQYQM